MQLEVEIARMQEEIANLKQWQRTQNGTLVDLHREIRELRERFDQRLEALNGRLIATLTSSLLVLGALVANLVVGKI